MPTLSVTSTHAKKAFGRMLDHAIRGNAVVITKHNAPTAVLLSMEEFAGLKKAGEARLDTLSKQFDALLDRMQTRKVRAGMKAAFDATPKELGRVAVASARKRR